MLLYLLIVWATVSCVNLFKEVETGKVSSQRHSMSSPWEHNLILNCIETYSLIIPVAYWCYLNNLFIFFRSSAKPYI